MSAQANVQVRPGLPADLRRIEEIENQVFADPWSRMALLTELQTDRFRVPFVAVQAEQVVGYLMAWRVMDQLHILNLAVDPDFGRHGVGTLLLRTALARAGALGLCEATLEVRESNAGAIVFYRRHGFTTVGRRPRYYADTQEDALIMTVALGSE
ncbi:MAG: ribosomal protein S18-alanine N-acetyltransferase [bacterium]